MIVLATGISGVGKRRYFREVQEWGKLNGLDIALYDAGAMLMEVARDFHMRINMDNILNMQETQLTTLMGNVFERIARDVQYHDHAIVSTHAMFLWKQIWRDSNNALFLERLNPDRYITIIDVPEKIQANLKKDDKWRREKVNQDKAVIWQDLEMLITSKYWAGMQKRMTLSDEHKGLLLDTVMPTVDEVLDSVNLTELYKNANDRKVAERLKQKLGTAMYERLRGNMEERLDHVMAKISATSKQVPFLALPIDQPPESLLKMMMFPDMKFAYSAFPMTNLENPEESYQKINEFMQNGGPMLETDVGLRDFFVVIDPRTYELNLKKSSPMENTHTVHRDLDYFVGYTDMTICYFPELVHSSGASTEMREAITTTKDVFLVMDKNRRSPFVDFNTTEFFHTPQPLFNYIKRREKARKIVRPEGYSL